MSIFDDISKEMNDENTSPEKCRAILNALFSFKSQQEKKRIYIPFLIDIRFKKKLMCFIKGIKAK